MPFSRSYLHLFCWGIGYDFGPFFTMFGTKGRDPPLVVTVGDRGQIDARKEVSGPSTLTSERRGEDNRGSWSIPDNRNLVTWKLLYQFKRNYFKESLSSGECKGMYNPTVRTRLQAICDQCYHMYREIEVYFHCTALRAVSSRGRWLSVPKRCWWTNRK